ncbi:class Ib ribonucleoside-diphosphate reductase assembly flavoprotein NrdI [Corynebacterium diphtheriae]|uniref:class Ib ribonucleoside-diphosphate reductase assembly flavoprotein NrdI n=1 Tax=Corynebacterium diphtheriae TaxID=1717 RepID=UPI000245B8F1|nr:class Ib ribonucleoside-diphosphate reductase assembly flavoprotein NrdI [Corynebacterium diphtheriae]AEX49411.1 ribonucleotide reductase stimulatory protein [Corynebacterium diphtheriae BH8]AEX70538.1 ribonucleotide reductase stimulatory protein [Corynebacterium diphtheriae PW8]EIK55462.1 ribonucleotide reductase stimulatory protein [Corynebacterium diphtheriae bv. intermedius str. NCTC 5011]OKY22547.1 ribonucleotide reductase [Corynebacterium diphtheriae]OWM39316.1 ribonucleotide reductas
MEASTSPQVIYFSSVSENTHRFIQKTKLTHQRIGLRTRDDPIIATAPYVLITPTYGGGDLAKAVPKQVIKFLNVEQNRHFLAGVITSGNRNFGPAFCFAGTTIAHKCNVPELHRFELLGTNTDAHRVHDAVIDILRERTTK